MLKAWRERGDTQFARGEINLALQDYNSSKNWWTERNATDGRYNLSIKPHLYCRLGLAHLATGMIQEAIDYFSELKDSTNLKYATYVMEKVTQR